MRRGRRIVSCLLATAAVAGCASTKVTHQETVVTERLPLPNRILVYDFVATAGDVPADSALAGQAERTPQTAEHIEAGRRVGAEIAAHLVKEIRAVGLPAERASTRAPQMNDIVIRGYLLSVDEGSAGKRVVIGFGAGTSQLSVAVEGYQMTARGLRKLGSGTLGAAGSKGPGIATTGAVAIATGNPLGLLVNTGMKAYGEMSGRSTIDGRADQAEKAIADHLKPRFRQQGWID
jgi:hypothetical protein